MATDLEFGGTPAPEPIINKPKKTRPNPEKMDELIKDGKTPDQFLSSYDYDETQRNVIVFRKPTIRDLQIYDVCKFESGEWGIITAMRSFQQIYMENVLYQFGKGYSTNVKEMNDRNLMKMPDTLSRSDNAGNIKPDAAHELQVLMFHAKIRSFEDMLSLLKCSTTKPVKTYVKIQHVKDVVEIHKNLFQMYYDLVTEKPKTTT